MSDKQLKTGDRHYRHWVGPAWAYSHKSAMQFVTLANLGLREQHNLLDIGCGSLRAGKLFIPFLKIGNYYGLEPEKWVLEEGIEHELGQGIIDLKKPKFTYNYDFDLTEFKDTKFDFVLAQSVFSHTTRKQIRQCLQSVKNHLKPDGIFVFNFGEGPDSDPEEWVYPGCCTYSENLMRFFVENSGMKMQRIRDKVFSGQDWFIAALPSCDLDSYRDFFVSK